MRDLAYLKLMSREYPTLESASSEIVNLMAICGLPKGTEYFFSDLHGEYEAFIHLLRSSSGIIREKIKETFGHIISEEDEIQLANLIYYPDRQIAKLKQEQNYTEDWQRIALYRLVPAFSSGTKKRPSNRSLIRSLKISFKSPLTVR